ncbi:MAG: hypothetical protein Q9187_004566 [Circinaria calcarea]
MATTAAYFDRKPASSVRPGLSQVQRVPDIPSSPHTPQRSTSSAFSSPATSYRTEEDALIFEFGSRYFRAGFAGENAPRCTLGFGPEESRRVGDYRRWLPGYNERPRKTCRIQEWGNDYQLWRMDIREVDLGLVEDKVERAVREACNQYLLLDAKSRRVVLVLPSVLPHPLLSALLSTIFTNFQNPTITLFSAPSMAVMAAGLRSGLVVDIGWNESVVTGVCEYREMLHRRTTRAMRLVSLEMAKLLQQEQKKQGQLKARQDQSLAGSPDDRVLVDLEHAEEVTIRLAWCQNIADASVPNNQNHNMDARLHTLHIDEVSSSNNPSSPRDIKSDTSIPVSLHSSSFAQMKLPFSTFSQPVETVLFARNQSLHDLDDHEQSLPLLIYKSLLSLPPDLRGLCMSRIIITGGGSNIPGLKTRLISELSRLVEQRGWDPVVGKAADERRRRLTEIHINRQSAAAKPHSTTKSTEKNTDRPPDTASSHPAAQEPQVPDPIAEKLRRNEATLGKPTVTGEIRGVETLGAWVGASLAAALKVKGIVEIERDSYLQHGLSGARRDADVSVVQQRQSFGAGVSRSGGAEKVPWTLGAWA